MNAAQITGINYVYLEREGSFQGVFKAATDIDIHSPYRGVCCGRLFNETPRRRDSGVSLGRFINFNNPPLPPFSKVGLEETPQQRLRGIENLINPFSTR